MPTDKNMTKHLENGMSQSEAFIEKLKKVLLLPVTTLHIKLIKSFFRKLGKYLKNLQFLKGKKGLWMKKKTYQKICSMQASVSGE